MFGVERELGVSFLRVPLLLRLESYGVFGRQALVSPGRVEKETPKMVVFPVVSLLFKTTKKQVPSKRHPFVESEPS